MGVKTGTPTQLIASCHIAQRSDLIPERQKCDEERARRCPWKPVVETHLAASQEKLIGGSDNGFSCRCGGRSTSLCGSGRVGRGTDLCARATRLVFGRVRVSCGVGDISVVRHVPVRIFGVGWFFRLVVVTAGAMLCWGCGWASPIVADSWRRGTRTDTEGQWPYQRQHHDKQPHDHSFLHPQLYLQSRRPSRLHLTSLWFNTAWRGQRFRHGLHFRTLRRCEKRPRPRILKEQPRQFRCRTPCVAKRFVEF